MKYSDMIDTIVDELIALDDALNGTKVNCIKAYAILLDLEGDVEKIDREYGYADGDAADDLACEIARYYEVDHLRHQFVLGW